MEAKMGVLLTVLLALLPPAGSEDFPRRSVYPEPDPEVCVVLISATLDPLSPCPLPQCLTRCCRPALPGAGYESATVSLEGLGPVYARAIAYLEGQRGGATRPLRYEVVWLDNGSSEDGRDGFRRRRPQLEATLLEPRNVGLYGAMNTAWFGEGGCRAPYILSLEDDWAPRSAPTGGWSDSHLARSMAVLAQDEGLSGVRLKDDWTDTVVPCGGWQRARGEGGAEATRYRRQCTDIANGLVWGSFSSAAVLYDRERLLSRVGRLHGLIPAREGEMPWEYGEGNYAVRCGLPTQLGGGGLCTARPHFADACDPAARKEGEEEQQHCHAVFEELRPKTPRDLSDYRWFLWGTALHPDNQTTRGADAPQRTEKKKASKKNKKGKKHRQEL